jgi:hypothetical protein
VTRGKGNNHRRVRHVLCMNLVPKNFGGAWRRVHRRIWLIFAALDRSASDLLIGGILLVDLCLDNVDLKRGSFDNA